MDFYQVLLHRNRNEKPFNKIGEIQQAPHRCVMLVKTEIEMLEKCLKAVTGTIQR